MKKIETIKELLAVSYPLVSFHASKKEKQNNQQYAYDDHNLIPVVKKLIDESGEGYSRTSPVLSFTLYTQEQKERNKKEQQEHQESRKEIEAILNNPNIPEATKNLFRNI